MPTPSSQTPRRELLVDRLRHAIQYAEAARVSAEDALRLTETQDCRDCGRPFPYDPEADICPECVRAMHPDG